jgi:hypothetical protein
LVAATGFFSSMLRDMTILLYAVRDDTATLVRAELQLWVRLAFVHLAGAFP